MANMTTQEILQGIKDWAAPKVIYDISAAHNNTKYTDLADALGTNGGNIPQEYKKGGITVRFVHTSDNKYVQYRYMGTAVTGEPNPFLDTANWQGVDDEPVAGSKNLIESGGVAKYLFLTIDDADITGNGYIKASTGQEGDISTSSSWTYWAFKNSNYLSVRTHVFLGDASTEKYLIAFYSSETISHGNLISGIEFTASEETIDVPIPNNTKLFVVCSRTSTQAADDSTVCVRYKNSERFKELDEKIQEVDFHIPAQKVDIYSDLTKEDYNSTPGFAGWLGGSAFDYSVENSNHKVIEVKSGDVVNIQGDGVYFYVLKSYHIGDTTPDFCDTINTRQSAGGGNITIPSDAHYIAVTNQLRGNDKSPKVFSINGINLINNFGSDDYLTLVEEYDVSNWNTGKIVNNGAIQNTSDSTYLLSNAITVNRGDVIKGAHMTSNLGTNSSYGLVAKVDDSLNVLEVIVNGLGKTNNIPNDFCVTVSDDCKIVIAARPDWAVRRYSSTKDKSVFNQIESKDKALDTKIDERTYYYKDFSQDYLEKKNGYPQVNGTYNTSSVWTCKLFENHSFIKIHAVVGASHDAPTEEKVMVGFYSQNPFENDVTPIAYVNPTAGIDINNITVDVPTGCKYITIASRNQQVADSTFEGAISIKNLLYYANNDKFDYEISFNESYAVQKLNAYLKISTSELKTSSGYDSYIFDVDKFGINKIKATLSGNSSGDTAAIAYLSDAEITNESIIDTVAFEEGATNYDIDTLPAGTKYIFMSNRTETYTTPVYGVISVRETSCKDVVQELDNQKYDYNIVKLNKDIEHVIKGCSAFSGTDYSKVAHKYLTLMHVSDLHGDAENFNRIVEFSNCYKDSIDAILDSGDLQKECWKKSTDTETLLGANISDIDMPYLFNVGNHETGYSPDVETIANYGVNTIANCVTRYVTPYMSYNGCVQGDSGNGAYYYKDFSSYKIRIIFLFEYEMPRVVDENDNTQYKYDYWSRYISQTQVSWLVSTLNSVEIGWSVVIVTHQLIDVISEYDDKFKSEHTISTPSTAQDNLIQDIVDAYISKSSLSKTYSNTKSYPTTDVPDVTAVADFTNAKGDFICYLCGHTHYDKIGQSSEATNKQVVVCMTTSGTGKAYYDDIWRVKRTKSQDCFNMVVFDTDKKRIRLLRVGADTTLNMDKRDMTSISYAQE